MNKPTYSLNIEVMKGQELFLQARPIPLIGFRPTESTGDVEYCSDYPSAPVQDRLYVTPTGARIYRGGRFIEFPVLAASGKLRIAQMPDGISGGDDGEYIPVEWRGRANGVASLNAKGVVPSSQLPQMNYISRTEKGAANGVATLGQDGKVTPGQLPAIKSEVAWEEVTDKPEFAKVATSGSYNDLADKPDLTKKANLMDGKVPEGELPKAIPNGGYGVIKYSTDYGLRYLSGSGRTGIQTATISGIDGKTDQYRPVTPSNLDYAVRSVLPNVTTIPAATTAYSLLDASATTNSHSWQYFHAPSSASTYVFPAVTDTTVAHRIKLTIDFTAVQTYSFEDAEGTAIAPLFTPTISAGDVYEFDCEYSSVKSQWLVWPHKQGAVSDDYVMQSQVGAANGVAGLDENGKVPEGELPKASATQAGILKPYSVSFNVRASDTQLSILSPTTKQIDNRASDNLATYRPLSLNSLNYAVTAALTDSNKIRLTDAQKLSAQDTLGVGAAPIIGTTAPTTSTAGSVGQLYVDIVASKTYHCTGVTNTGTEAEPAWSYTWVDDVNAKGGTFGGNIHIGQNCYLDTYHNGRTVVIGKGAIIKCGYNANASMGDFGGLLVGYNISNWYSGSTLGEGGAAFGYGLAVAGNSALFSGKYNQCVSGARVVGGGSDSNNRYNIEELTWGGNHYIRGGYQQYVTKIPPATTSYMLTEGNQSHVPSNASTYTLPTIQVKIYTADYGVYVRNTSLDGNGYYGWNWGATNRYTASATPAVGDNTYTNTALSSGAKAVTAIDERTHECILDIDFSTIQTFSFEDADGNVLSLQKDITVLTGDKWRFICIYEYGTWLIYPLQLKAETVTPTTPVSISGDTATAISEQLSATASGNGILSYTATGLPDGVTCSSTGLISGTPTTAGTYEATVTVRTPYSKPATITVNFTITQSS